MASLPGLTVGQAKQRLEELGLLGTVSVKELSSFDPHCKEGTVCMTDHKWGAFKHEDIVLGVNQARLGIAAPPR